LIDARRVLVAGAVAEKAARLVAPSDNLLVTEPKRFVSRGGEKLAAALAEFPVRVSERVCLDAGAATGGFTDCLLQNGAERVWAVDVGHGQLAPRLREDSRVAVFERLNIRHATLEELRAPPFQVVVTDLSFISLTSVALTLCQVLSAPGADLVLLVKPQFEAGKSEASKGKGVIKDPAIWRRTLLEVATTFGAAGSAIMGIMASPILGPAGNAEFLMHAIAPGDANALPDAEDVGALADEAIKSVPEKH
jgi:23S rRNA (cytidine1920-2'-O)/16S rRNA (cytidine1409-2'-O)-methyltransferase